MIKNLDKILMVISEILNQLVHLAQNNWYIYKPQNKQNGKW